MKRLALVLLAVLGWSCLVRGSAVAAPRYLLVSDQATFTTSDGTTTLAYSLVNLTDRAATVSLSAAGSSCAFRPDSAALLPAREQKVTFTVTGCEPPTATSTTLTLKAGTASFEVTGAPGSTSDPPWPLLWILLGGPCVGAALVCLGRRRYSNHRGPLPPAALGTRLPGLSASWSFKDSWAANVTLVSAVFTGLFGTSGLLKSLTGDESTSVVAVITIASAIAVAVVGIAPLLLQITQSPKGEPIVVSLLVAAAVAAGMAGALVLIIGLSVARLIPTGPEIGLWIGIGIALLMLAAYAVTAVDQNLITGLTPTEADAQKASMGQSIKAALPGKLTDDDIEQRVLPHIPVQALTRDRPAALI